MMDTMMTCAAGNAAEVRTKLNIPAWRYRYMGVWENTNLGPGTGAYHSGEIPVVFGTTELRTGNVKDSPEEAKVVKDTMKAWATFAKDPQKGLIGLGWPIYDPTSKLARCNNGSILLTSPQRTRLCVLVITTNLH
jgi:cholinesterase